MIYWKLAAYIAAAVVCFAAGSSHKDAQWKATWNAHIAADAKALNKAVADARADEKRIAKQNQTAAVAAAKADRKIEVHTQYLTKEVPRYVTAHQDAVGCVTYGLVRLHDAAILGVDPSTLGLPPGKSDDACSPVKPSDLGRALAAEIGAFRQNAGQLDALIVNVRETVDTYNKEKPHE